jgi:hypothetical protein
MFAKDNIVKLSTGEFNEKKENPIFNQKTNNHYNQILKIEVPNQLKTELKVDNIIDSENLLDNLKPIMRFIGKNILKLKPGYFRFHSDFTIEHKMDNKEIKKESGKTLHEMVILR